MKRHPALVTLSHDHHHALFVAHQLRKADEQTADAAASALSALWDNEMRDHLRVEDEVLLPAVVEAGIVAEHEMLARVAADHLLIRRDIRALDGAPSLEQLHEIGARLSEHVRFEERQLFPLLEAELSEQQLTALGEEITSAEAQA